MNRHQIILKSASRNKKTYLTHAVKHAAYYKFKSIKYVRMLKFLNVLNVMDF